MNYIDKVHKKVRDIPEGRVTTYGSISKSVGIDPRMVGWALHANKDENTPCHRVVDRNGRLASNFAFDGPDEQRRRLKAEGIEFKDDMHVDLKKYLWEVKK